MIFDKPPNRSFRPAVGFALCIARSAMGWMGPRGPPPGVPLPAGRWMGEPGLHGAYFKTGRTRARDLVLERVDPEIRFDFGRGGPLPAQSDQYQFAMRWEGSVLAPET